MPYPLPATLWHTTMGQYGTGTFYQFILPGDFEPVYIVENGSRSEITIGPVYLTETSY